jgi:hypothetical protein
MSAEARVPVSDRHFEKDDRGRWVLLFGRFDGSPIGQVPSWYLRWSLQNVKFLKGPIRTAINRTLRSRYDGSASEPDDPSGGFQCDGEEGCCCDVCQREAEFLEDHDLFEWGDQ